MRTWDSHDDEPPDTDIAAGDETESPHDPIGERVLLIEPSRRRKTRRLIAAGSVGLLAIGAAAAIFFSGPRAREPVSSSGAAKHHATVSPVVAQGSAAPVAAPAFRDAARRPTPNTTAHRRQVKHWTSVLRAHRVRHRPTHHHRRIVPRPPIPVRRRVRPAPLPVRLISRPVHRSVPPASSSSGGAPASSPSSGGGAPYCPPFDVC